LRLADKSRNEPGRPTPAPRATMRRLSFNQTRQIIDLQGDKIFDWRAGL
jgi:hypothetical protein